MLQPQKLVIFTLDEQRYALHLAAVERVVRMVELTSLPKAPEIVLGVVNVRGRVVPVVNLRKRFGLAERELHLSEHIILAHTLKRVVALVVDVVRSTPPPDPATSWDCFEVSQGHVNGGNT